MLIQHTFPAHSINIEQNLMLKANSRNPMDQLQYEQYKQRFKKNQMLEIEKSFNFFIHFVRLHTKQKKKRVRNGF